MHGVVSHFRVHERIGEGGMGTVHRAEDLRLGREVALKFLSAAITGDANARQRFLLEAKAASALDHPNVCTIHEVGEADDGTIFIAMAYYRGETLSQRLRRLGHLPAGEAVTITVQLVRGLERAHSLGIVHRDLKPGNIFLTQDGLVKLLDFGLASLAGEAHLTRSGMLLGTAAYMSPEQVLGEQAGPRSDLWSVGVVLYEMLAGRLPFKGPTEAALLYAIAHGEAPDLREIRPGLPESLYATVRRCLSRLPADRPGSAGEVRRELELEERSLVASDERPTETFLRGGPRAASGAAPPPGSGLAGFGPSGRPVLVPPATAETMPRAGGSILRTVSTWLVERRRPVRLGTAAVVVLTLAIASWAVMRGGAAASAAGPRRIAVLPLVNSTGDRALDELAKGIGASLGRELARSSGVDLVFGGATVPQGALNGRDLARELGVDTVLVGEVVQRQRGLTKVRLDLLDGGTGALLWSRTVEERSDRVVDLQAALVQEVAEEIDRQVPDRSSDGGAPTPSEEAYRLYLIAEALAPAIDDDPTGRVEELLREATRIDPQFALAHARLAQVLARRVDSEKTAELLAEAKQRAERALALSPGLLEGSSALAEIAVRGGKFAMAIEMLKPLVAQNPQVEALQTLLAEAYRRNGNAAMAERTLRQALHVRPGYWRHWDHLGNLLLRLGDYEGAREAYQRAASLTRENATIAWDRLGTLELMRGDFPASLAAYAHLPQPITDAEVASNLGTAHFFAGDLGEAERHYRLALRLRPASPAFHANLGDVYARQGRVEAARRAYGDAADAVTANALVTPLSYDGETGRALYLAKAARCDEAQALARDLAARFDGTAGSAATLAKAHAACGEAGEAITLLERALDLGYSPAVLAGQEELKPIAGDPRLQRLLAEYAG
jgi:Flp pilus assembly protein TadD/TolB-like protein